MPEPVTKLDLVKRLAREAGEHASGPVSTLLQRGNNLKLVDDIDTAYSEIQTYQTTWMFHRKSFEKVLTIGQATYTAAQLDITDLRNWDRKKVKLYKILNDECPLVFIPLDTWENTYGMGSNTTEPGRPHSFTIQANKSITLFPNPNYAFTVRGQYQSRPHSMDEDEDEPIFDVEYRMAIVWKALENFGFKNGESACISFGQKEYAKVLRMLEKQYLPRMKHGRPLA